MRLRALSWMAAVMLAAVAVPAGAAMILKMNLAQLTDRADAIFRGEVLSAEPGKISPTDPRPTPTLSDRRHPCLPSVR